MALTFVDESELPNLKKIEFLTNKKFTVKDFPGFKMSPKPGLVQDGNSIPSAAPAAPRRRQYYRKPVF
jgi:hypothetical protein